MDKVISIFVLLVALAIVLIVLPALFPSVNTNQFRAKQDIRLLHDAVNLFAQDVGRLPSNQEGLEALISLPEGMLLEGYNTDGYLKRLPIDPWGYQYHYYRVASENDTDVFEIWSYGADGIPGGEDYYQDVRWSPET